MSDTISAPQAIEISKLGQGFSWLDVRSENEYSETGLPLSHNIPILNNQHRHLVGLTYKTTGNQAAVELGHQLVAPLKEQMVEQWRAVLNNQQNPILFCWRGGLRSQIAWQWLNDHGLRAQRVLGGYKAIRRELFCALERLPSFTVLSGPTGSNKTKLLHELDQKFVLDLEQLACHRGSAFGGWWNQAQPAQATFENSLFWRLYHPPKQMIVEDESRLIGHRCIPDTLYHAMATAPRVTIEMSIEQRSENIARDYVLSPLTSGGRTRDQLLAEFHGSLLKIKARLGGALYQDLFMQMKEAFTSTSIDLPQHMKWITTLLADYYDKAYHHSFSKKNCPILFTGSYAECSDWLRNHLQLQVRDHRE